MIYYKKRRKYKYNLHLDYSINTGIEIKKRSRVGLLTIGTDGKLLIKAGYAWDGPSGPTIDTKNFMRGSLVHDALYQLMREGIIPRDQRKKADELLREICRDDGMSKVRAWWVYRGVRLGGGSSTQPDMLSAP